MPHVEAARRDQHDLGVRREQRVKPELSRVLAGAAEQIAASRHLDHLRHPVTSRHQRVKPFDAGERGARGHPRARAATASMRAIRRPTNSAPRAGSPSARATRSISAKMAAVLGRERGYLRRAKPASDRVLDVALADRAYLALRLGDDDVGS